ncbi:MAG: ParB/RepB/Spo0J family partition protein [Alphaproteobacteria bacterium]|nr:ParB/RepB/Spo0J family partition protein [Alphaproteobacteria bacterium]
MKNKGLGRGLAVLIGQSLGSENEELPEGAIAINIKDIEPNPFQPRKVFDEDGIAELASSIASHGIIQPIVVRNFGDNKYQIVAGERRWRASLLAGLDKVPVIVKQIDDKELAEQALIENIQRLNLNPIEEANAYSELMEKYNYSQEQLSRSLGKSRSHIANMLRVTSMPDAVKKYIAEGKLSFGHAKVIAGNARVEFLAKEIVSKDLSVRQTEDLAKSLDAKKLSQQSELPAHSDSNASAHDADELGAIALSLSEVMGMKVEIHRKGSSGKVAISFNSYVQLDDIIELLSSAKFNK